MPGGTHDQALLAAFQDGEIRMVYARHKDEPAAPLYYLKDGTAAELRSWAKSTLECFMPECGDRRLTTVARRTKRDGFAHMRGAGGHSAEGLFHQQAKEVVRGWVEEKYHGQIAAQVESSTSDGTRRADVMLIGQTGHRIAVEIQYAALTVEQWMLRTRSYLDQGITPLWLWGHTATHFRLQSSLTGEARVELSPALWAVVEFGSPVLWINPITRQVATVWLEASAHKCETPTCRCPRSPRKYRIPPHSQDERQNSPVAYRVGIDSLDDCELSRHGLISPTLRALHAEAEAFVSTASES